MNVDGLSHPPAALIGAAGNRRLIATGRAALLPLPASTTHDLGPFLGVRRLTHVVDVGRKYTASPAAHGAPLCRGVT